jgi:hypothetical protein
VHDEIPNLHLCGRQNERFKVTPFCNGIFISVFYELQLLTSAAAFTHSECITSVILSAVNQLQSNTMKLLVRSLCFLLLAVTCTAAPTTTTTVVYDEQIFGCANDGDMPDVNDPRCKLIKGASPFFHDQFLLQSKC